MVGLTVFYPSSRSRVELLVSLMRVSATDKQPNGPKGSNDSNVLQQACLLRPLLLRLNEDELMADLFRFHYTGLYERCEKKGEEEEAGGGVGVRTDPRRGRADERKKFEGERQLSQRASTALVGRMRVDLARDAPLSGTARRPRPRRRRSPRRPRRTPPRTTTPAARFPRRRARRRRRIRRRRRRRGTRAVRQNNASSSSPHDFLRRRSRGAACRCLAASTARTRRAVVVAAASPRARTAAGCRRVRSSGGGARRPRETE